MSRGDDSDSERDCAFHFICAGQNAARYRPLHEDTGDVARSATGPDRRRARAIESWGTMWNERQRTKQDNLCRACDEKFDPCSD